MAGKAKNVLLILTDQQRKDSIGAYGNGFVQTENIDRLAAEGVRFERTYCQNPFCCPSRASILTGLYQRTHGLWHNGIRFDEVGVPTLGDILTQEGFRTGSVGKIHLGPRFGPHPPAGFEESSDYWDRHPEMRRWREAIWGSLPSSPSSICSSLAKVAIRSAHLMFHRDTRSISARMSRFPGSLK